MTTTQAMTGSTYPNTTGASGRRGPAFYEAAALGLSTLLTREAVREMYLDGLITEQTGSCARGRITLEGTPEAKERWGGVIRRHKNPLVYELSRRDGTRFDLLRAVVKSRSSLRDLIQQNPRVYSRFAKDRAIFDWMACYEPEGMTGKQLAAEWGLRRSQWLGTLFDAEHRGWVTIKRVPGVSLDPVSMLRGKAVGVPTEATLARIVTAKRLWPAGSV